MNPEQSPLLIVISGPTAVGKTRLSIRIAQLLGAEIISADSRQVYREMNIGTAKPSLHERQIVPHHFIDHKHIHDAYSAGMYEQEVLDFLKDYFTRKPIALLVGGTGFYIQAVLKGLDRFPRVDREVKSGLESDLEGKGLHYLQDELKQKDPETYLQIDIQNPRRVIRALEVIRQSGKTFSSFKQHASERRMFRSLKIRLNRDRDELYQRIHERVDNMLEEGLMQEARELYPYKDLRALQTVGYQEWFDHFDGKIDKSTAIEKIKQHTRNYAKRQLTWFRKKEGWQVFHADDKEAILSFLQDHALVKAALKHSPEDGQ